ncbi:hypothetical protein OUZ56_006167 [Daphnia magna]|uniref:Uncharacterized protein n=1 Tax=Daphnia magna TaxID=35525 RepID=A0ABQ9YUW7_9CRUS|nr:hypothetical protein OUZ56_006167 [Daphnia magna]
MMTGKTKTKKTIAVSAAWILIIFTMGHRVDARYETLGISSLSKPVIGTKEFTISTQSVLKQHATGWATG